MFAMVQAEAARWIRLAISLGHRLIQIAFRDNLFGLAVDMLCANRDCACIAQVVARMMLLTHAIGYGAVGLVAAHGNAWRAPAKC